jgi:hypothetical protein
MVSYILCGDCIHISLDLLLYFVLRYLVLNKWYQSTFLGQTLWAHIFYFCRFFFGVEKRGLQYSQSFWYIYVQHLQKKGCISEFISEKHPILKKQIARNGVREVKILKF